MLSNDEYNRDLKALMSSDTFTEKERDAVAFLLACIYCGRKPRKIAQLAGLKRVVVRRFMDLTDRYLTDPQHGLVMSWPDEKYGTISFVLDVMVVQGELTRSWNDEEKQFYWQAVPEDKRLPPPVEKRHRKSDKHVVEIKLSARKEGLVPLV